MLSLSYIQPSACRAVQYAHTSRYLCMHANMDLILSEQNIPQNKPENNFVEDTMKMEATQMVQNTVSSGGQPSRLLSRQQTQLGGTEMCIKNSSTSSQGPNNRCHYSEGEASSVKVMHTWVILWYSCAKACKSSSSRVLPSCYSAKVRGQRSGRYIFCAAHSTRQSTLIVS